MKGPQIHSVGFVYYESRKRELKIRLMNEGRCVSGSTRNSRYEGNRVRGTIIIVSTVL